MVAQGDWDWFPPITVPVPRPLVWLAGHLPTFLLQRPPPVLDALGRVISESPPDQWEARYKPCFDLVLLQVF